MKKRERKLKKKVKRGMRLVKKMHREIPSPMSAEMVRQGRLMYRFRYPRWKAVL